MTIGHVARRQQRLEPAVGVGERRQHGMAAIKPYRLVTATGRARGAVGAGAHGGACMALRWRPQILPLGGLGLYVTPWICEQRAPLSTGSAGLARARVP